MRLFAKCDFFQNANIRKIRIYAKFHFFLQRWYLNEKTLVGLFIAFIITPLACLRNVKNLGYTSAIAIFAIIFFVVTVITQKDFAAEQCPLEYPEGKFLFEILITK